MNSDLFLNNIIICIHKKWLKTVFFMSGRTLSVCWDHNKILFIFRPSKQLSWTAEMHSKFQFCIENCVIWWYLATLQKCGWWKKYGIGKLRDQIQNINMFITASCSSTHVFYMLWFFIISAKLISLHAVFVILSSQDVLGWLFCVRRLCRSEENQAWCE